MANSYRTMPEMLEASLEFMEKAVHGRNQLIGFSTGFKDLDSAMLGLKPSSLVFVAGRPSMGVFNFVLQVLENALVSEKQKALFYSSEATAEQVSMHLLSITSGIELYRLTSGHIGSDEWKAVKASYRELIKARSLFDFTPNVSIKGLEKIIRRHRANNCKGLTLVVIDSLSSLISDKQRKKISRKNLYAKECRILKSLAEEFGICVLVLGDISREVECRENKRPRLKDIVGSSAVQAYADDILLIYRDEIYNHRRAKSDVAEVFLAKNMLGTPTTTLLSFVQGRFSALDIII